MTTPVRPTLRLGTRASALAVTQSGMIADRLRTECDVDVELVTISTEGDRSSAPLASMGGQGVFVAALREALVRGDVDLAVHSLKDLPTSADPRLTVAAIPRREDPRDVLVARDGLTLGELPQGARIGTGSPRREAQLRALGLGVEVVGIRGNVDTRIGRIAAGEVDGVLLARAGLLRLGRADEATEVIDPLQMLPAPGQGALACECRVDDDATIQLLQRLDDGDTRAAVTAERSLLATLEAGCSAPVGALAEIAEGDHGDELWLRAVVGDVSGSPTIRLSATGLPSEAAAVGERLAVEMLAEGADALMAVASS
ncbi:hydroxymethylbilane synthase [Aeromicrobium fastidiosum]|uniref:Porphobilinogen deaminase n=1 Tax=Aeromicrobium fastidiosum TaxID=52699 RepID=A0A641AKA2_9ACTN|nr:hydroxymethylbilane synthase [Aeromicrobium fastidiosum]KAA1374855.1 hydroxymethylbilane synthase [Aeromicrobium fastidiosum]MBP2390584.1 hydroxymethylbilane synthase [Aeromicrobium fastidiosum]